MSIDFDYNEEELPSFELIPKGDYLFEVVKSTFDTVSNGQNVGAKTVEIRVALVAISDSEGIKAGQKMGNVSHTFYITEKALPFFKAFLVCANYQINGRAMVSGDRVSIKTADVLIGLRGICRNSIEASKDNADRKFNRIAHWYTDKAKYPRFVPSKIDAADIPKKKVNFDE